MFRFLKSFFGREVPQEFAPVVRHIEELRELERAAAADPGYENWSTDHVTTEAYDRYEASWLELHDRIHSGPLPEVWFWFHAWLQQNNPAFGDVDGTADSSRRCRWSPAMRSLRTVLLKSIERRAVERLARPEDETLWMDPRVRELLVSLAPIPPAQGGAQLATVLERLTPVLQIDESALDSWVRRRLEQLRTQAIWFEYHGLDIVLEEDAVSIRVSFSESLPDEEDVWLHVADRDTRDTFHQLTFRLKKQGGKLVPWKPHDPPLEIRVEGGRAEARVFAELWLEELKIAPGTILAMDIRFAGAGYLAGCVPAPEVSVPAGSAARPVLRRCSSCREWTPVFVDGEFCPACRVERLSPNRPIASSVAARLEQVRREWAAAACPACGARRFARRFPELFSGQFRCEKCQKDFSWRDGKLTEPGPRERQWLAMAGAIAALEADLENGAVQEATLAKFDEALEALSPASLTRGLGKAVRRAKERLSADSAALRSAGSPAADRVLASVLRAAEFLKRAAPRKP